MTWLVPLLVLVPLLAVLPLTALARRICPGATRPTSLLRGTTAAGSLTAGFVWDAHVDVGVEFFLVFEGEAAGELFV